MTQALLLVAHGSRRQESNQEVQKLTALLAQRVTGFEQVACAFLELAEPDIVTGGCELIAAGASSLTVLPYFLVNGRHVHTDIPAAIDQIRSACPDAQVSITSYLGAANSVVDSLLEIVIHHENH